MSFEFQLQPCQSQAESPQQSSGDEAARPSQWDAMRKLLYAAAAPTPGADGYYHPHLADCSKVEVALERPDEESDLSGVKVRLYGYSRDNMRFLFSLADQGNLAILPAGEEGTAVVTAASQEEDVSARWPNATAVTTPGELMSVLKAGRETLPAFRKEAVAEMKAKSKRSLSSGYRTLAISIVSFVVLRGFFFALSPSAASANSTSMMPWHFLAGFVGFLSIAVLVIGLLISSIQIAQDKGYSGELGFSAVLGIPIVLIVTAFLISVFLRQVDGNFYIGVFYIPQIYILLLRLLTSIGAVLLLPVLGLCTLAILPYKIRIKYADMFPV